MSTYSVDHRNTRQRNGLESLRGRRRFPHSVRDGDRPLARGLGPQRAQQRREGCRSSTLDAERRLPAVGAVATPSFAGIAPANAADIAMKHAAFPATLAAAPAGPVAHVNLSIADRVVAIAPGISYHAWTFGKTAPGPVIHVRSASGST